MQAFSHKSRTEKVFSFNYVEETGMNKRKKTTQTSRSNKIQLKFLK